jgi:hypothetical protein
MPMKYVNATKTVSKLIAKNPTSFPYYVIQTSTERKIIMKILLFILALCFAMPSFATDIASCSKPRGKSYYPELGLLSKKDAGWTDDEIAEGTTKLIKLNNGGYDILFVDSSKQIISSTNDGGNVLMLNYGENIVSFLVLYPEKTAEIYTFLKNKSGDLEYIHVLSRAGDSVPLPKSSLMVGKCDYINFDAL